MGLLDFRWQTCGQEQVRFALRVFQRPRFLRHPHFKYFGGFFGFYHELLQLDRLTYQQRERIWSFQWRFESWWHRGDDLTHIPLLLSQLPGSNFWLFLHFSFHLCASLSSAAIILETIASSLAELLPNAWSDRTKLSKNLP